MTVLDEKTAISELCKHYADGRLIPFIGSGFSKPLGLPTWQELIKSLAKEMGYEEDLFILHGSNAQLAEYVKLVKKSIWMDWIHQITVDFDSKETIKKRKHSITHQALASKEWHTIYTTNYDSHIEGALQDARKKCISLASLADFLEPREPDACEVIKFHGTLKDPETLILTEEDYFKRMELESAPDQRLRADILSNSFMFIGYSFADPNIRFIWYKIFELRKLQHNEDHVSLRPSYFVTFGVNPIQPILLNRWNIHVINLDPQDMSNSIRNFIDKIHK